MFSHRHRPTSAMSDHITDDKKRRLDAFQRGALLVYMRDRNHKHTEACWMEYGPSCARRYISRQLTQQVYVALAVK